MLRGQIDLWFVEGGELILVDYKTDQWGRTRRQRARKPTPCSCGSMPWPWSASPGRLPDQALVCLLRSGHAAPISLGEAELRHAAQTVRAFREAQNEPEIRSSGRGTVPRLPLSIGGFVRQDVWSGYELGPPLTIFLARAVMSFECRPVGMGSGSRPL